jgi:hypothetical protein
VRTIERVDAPVDPQGDHLEALFGSPAEEEESPAVARKGPPERSRRAAGGALATAFYFVVACLCYWPTGPLDASRIVFRPRSDLAQGAWFVEWVAYAVTHGLNPFFTNYILAPHGANLALDNTSPLLSLLVLPLTLSVGPIAAFDLLFRLGLALSGAGIYFMLRRYTRWWPAAVIGGLVFELSPYLIGHAHKHVFLTWVIFVPLLVLAVDDWLVSQRRGAVASGLLVGLLAGLQFLVSVEVLVNCAVFFAIGLLYLALTHRDQVRRRWAAAWRGASVAAPVFACLAGYPLYMMTFGPERPSAGLHDLTNLGQYHGDLLAPFLPSRYIWGHFTSAATNFVYGSPSENGFYLGVPLFLLLVYFAWRWRHDIVIATSGVVATAAFVLGLGSRLYVGGKAVFSPMPFSLITHLPLLKNLEAARMSLFIWFGAVVILAVGIDRLKAEGWRWQAGRRADVRRAPAPVGGNRLRAALACAVIVVSLAPVMPHLPIMSRRASEPVFFSTPRQLDSIPKGDIVLTYPYNYAPYDAPMLWQAMSGMRFRILGGEATVPGPRGVALSHAGPNAPPPLYYLLLAAAPSLREHWYRDPPNPTILVPMLRSFLRQNDVDDVLVSRHALHSGFMSQLVTAALGTRPLVLGGVDLWLHVRDDLDGGHAGHGSASG